MSRIHYKLIFFIVLNLTNSKDILNKYFPSKFKSQTKFKSVLMLFMTDPILYISMFLGLIGIYTLISSFSDDDDDNSDDGEKYTYKFIYSAAEN